MFRIAICDDKMHDLQELQEGVRSWMKKNTAAEGTISVFHRPEELRTYLRDNQKGFDLYLLDIVMAGENGIHFGKWIRRYDEEAFLIYVTTSKDYALDAYELHAVRYLVKPIESTELESAMDTAYGLFTIRPKHTLVVNGKNSVSSIVMEDVMYVENSLRTMTYTLNDGRALESVRRSGSFEASVGIISASEDFIQPHKSFFVNLRYVSALQMDHLVMDDGRSIPVARRRADDIQNKYMKFVSRVKKYD